MLQVSERGSPNFKRELQRRTNPIRAALHFRGDAHPTLGDTPNRMVRETAEQVTPLPQLHRDWATPILVCTMTALVGAIGGVQPCRSCLGLRC